MKEGWAELMESAERGKIEPDRAKGTFTTRDISIRKMYGNDGNFYTMPDVEALARDILAVGLLENMVVTYAPCERGTYRIIAGERRWRALKMLADAGRREFEVVTCQIKSPAEENEETVLLIMANAYRDKTVMDVLEEEKRLKAAIKYMKDNGLPLQGYDLESGRLRDVVADIMNMTGTKIAQIESINNRLIEEFTRELKEGRLTFSAAYEISGMDESGQRAMLERYKETGSLSWKDVKEAKAAAAKEEAEKDIRGQMNFPEDYEEDGENGEEWEEEQEKIPTDEEVIGTYKDILERGLLEVTDETTKTGLIEQLKERYGRSYSGFSAKHVEFVRCTIQGAVIEVKEEGRVKRRKLISWTAFVNRLIETGTFRPMKEVDAHPEAKESICYSCDNYEACMKKQTNVFKCDSYVDRKEARKTEEQRYSEEQDRIDRETQKKLEEMREAEEAKAAAARKGKTEERQKRYMRVSASMYDAIATGKIPYMILKKDTMGYRQGDRLTILAVKDMKATGEKFEAVVTCADDENTSSGITEGYAVIGVMDIYDAESLGLIDLEDED